MQSPYSLYKCADITHCKHTIQRPRDVIIVVHYFVNNATKDVKQYYISFKKKKKTEKPSHDGQSNFFGGRRWKCVWDYT